MTTAERISPAPKDDVIAIVINFNTAALTRRCTQSLLEAGLPRVLVLDNASARSDFEQLRRDHARLADRVRIIGSESNLGFAQGSNELIDEALSDPRCRRVLLLNSDAVIEPAGLDACLAAMDAGRHDLMGGRMFQAAAGGNDGDVDSLGIAIYGSLLASNRKSIEDAYLGPTGGLAIYSRGFLEEVKRAHGYVFDPTFFCYAEDSDLCMRARLLGFSAGYADEVMAHHEGQASTAGGHNDFVLYHGIRNSIWMAAKSIPASILLTQLPWVILLHGGIVLRHVLQGRWRTVWRLYRDALAGMPRVLAARRTVQATRRVPVKALRTLIDRQFYESRFLKGAIRDLFAR